MKKHRLTLISTLIIYSSIGVVLLSYYQYQINPDAISYISIAKKYLNADFHNAINGYWGPLISWLLVPFLSFGLPPLFAAKVLSLIIGLFTIAGIILLSYKFEINHNIRTIMIFFVLIPAILSFALAIITPDLLLLCFLTYYLNIIFSNGYEKKKSDGFLCGLTGSLAYLSKSYAFPFFVSHFLLINTLYYFKTRNNKVLINTILGLMVFFVISGTWVYLISDKYGYLTIGTAGKFGYAIMGPESKSYTFLDGQTGILREPPNETAINTFEDPCIGKTIVSWSPFESLSSFIYQLKTILYNIYNIILLMPVSSSAIIIAFILLLNQSCNKTNNIGTTLYPLITVILYSAGYTLFLVTERYFLIVYILLMLMGSLLASILFNSDFCSKIKKYTVLLLFVLSFAYSPLNQLVPTINAGKDIFELSKKLDSEYNIKGNIASNTNRDKSMFLSFHLNSRYFGYYNSVNIKMSNHELIDNLTRNKIDYYFVWDEPNSKSDPLTGYREITGGAIPSLKIYSLNKTEKSNPS